MAYDDEELHEGIPAPEVVALYVYDNTYRKPSLQTQMGLQDNPNPLTEMTAVTRIAAAEHLDMELPNYREQRPETVAAITDQVLKECRDMRKYRDGWPVARYIRIDLKNYHPKTAKGRKKSSKAKAGVNASRPRTKRPGPSRHSQGYNSAGAEATASVLQARAGSLEGRAESRAPSAARPESVVSAQGPPVAGPSRHVASTPDPEPDADLNAVPRFLSGLKIPERDVAKMVALFEAMGVETADYLTLFATMETRDMWLRELHDSGDLTTIQMRLLKEGLDRLGNATK